jgi:general secretion pathway protein L
MRKARLMEIGAILKRWIEILAALHMAWRDGRRERCSLIVTRESQQYVIRHAEPRRDTLLRDTKAGSVLATMPFGTNASVELARSVQSGFVIFELPAEKVIMRQITVPAQARKFLSGVVHNQIERLSPWPANGVVYGFEAEAGPEDAAAMEVRIFMSARGDIDAAQRELAAIGLPIDRIVARDTISEGAEDVLAPVALWSRLADASTERLPSAVRAIGGGIAAWVAGSLLIAGWALVSTASIRSESEDVAARSKVLQRQVQAGRTASSLAALPFERAWLLKSTSISSVVLIEALSRSVPDSAYVNEIRLEKDSLRILGLAENVPALLAPLERSGQMSDAHFVAPTARGPDGKLFRFSVEAHVEPRIKIGEH